MPITEINKPDATLTKACAVCSHLETVEIGTLQLGAESGGFADPNAIKLPPCAGCGRVETMFRTFDSHPANGEKWRSPHDQHRRVVNALSEHLKSEGQVHPDFVDTYKNESVRPPDMVEIGSKMEVQKARPVVVVVDSEPEKE